jgi:hypothetical protein
VRGIDEVKRDIRSADIPEAYEVIKVRRIPDEKAGVIPRRPDRVVAVHSVPSQVTEAYVIVDGGGIGAVLSMPMLIAIVTRDKISA